MSQHMVEPERTQTIWRLRVAYWISKPKRAQAYARARAPTPTHQNTDTHTNARTQAYSYLSPSRARTQKYVILPSIATVVS